MNKKCRYAVDNMQSVCLAAKGIKRSVSLHEETTLIGLTFGGYLRSKVILFFLHFLSIDIFGYIKHSSLFLGGIHVNPFTAVNHMPGNLFYCLLQIKCMKCLGKSERHERMMDLTVEIEGDIGTLEEALRRFTSTEVLDGDNKYQCDRCVGFAYLTIGNWTFHYF